MKAIAFRSKVSKSAIKITSNSDWRFTKYHVHKSLRMAAETVIIIVVNTHYNCNVIDTCNWVHGIDTCNWYMELVYVIGLCKITSS